MFCLGEQLRGRLLSNTRLFKCGGDSKHLHIQLSDLLEIYIQLFFGLRPDLFGLPQIKILLVDTFDMVLYRLLYSGDVITQAIEACLHLTEGICEFCIVRQMLLDLRIYLPLISSSRLDLNLEPLYCFLIFFQFMIEAAPAKAVQICRRVAFLLLKFSVLLGGN